MTVRHKVLALSFAAATLVSCSGGPEFETDGVNAPPASCELPPDQFGEAEELGTYRQDGCTATKAWRVTTIEGVRLSQPAIINCATANGIRKWLRQSVQPAAQSQLDSQVVELEVAASFACRPRNGRRGGKLSEHGFGNAIDISAVRLASGQTLSVERDYYGSKFLKALRQQACGIFRTVLGPGSDPYHRDHFHFDLANRRNGSTYCR